MRRQQRLQGAQRRIPISKRGLEETQPRDHPLSQPARAAALTGSQRVSHRLTGLGFAAGKYVQPRAEYQRSEQWDVASELQRSFHRVFCDQVRLGEVAPPHGVEADVEDDEDQIAFLALLEASALDRAHLPVGTLQ